MRLQIVVAALAVVCVAEQLPLKPTRTVEFSTDEGTWMSVDVSPDGKTLLFDLVGRLYTLPIEGGAATAITSGMSFDSQPRYSPDGKHIVFVSDRSGDDNLWLANADGSAPRALTSEDHAMFTSPAWSADGEYVLVSRKKPHFYKSAFELWEYDLNGGSGVQIVKSNATEATPPEKWQNALGVAAAPDGRHLYYAHKSGYFSTQVKFPLWQIARRDLRTGAEDPITSAQGSGFRPVLSPDGTKLIYATRYDSETGLRLRDLITGDDRWLKYPVQHDDQESYFSSRDLLPGYTFLPDGKEIVVSYGGKLHRLNIETHEDRLIPFTAKVSRELGPRLHFPARVDESPVRARVIQGAALAPDGKRLAFSALTHLYTLDLAAGSPQRLIRGSGAREYQPAWSPDGKWLAYVTWENEQGAIWKISADGSGSPQRLTTAPAYYLNPVWSPDSSRIVALRASKYQATTQADQWGHGMQVQELVWIPSNGGAPLVIASGEGFSGPHFTSDPERIYVTAMKAETPLAVQSQLLSLRWDGTDRRTLFNLKGRDVWGAEFSPTIRIVANPDGKRALALYRNQLYLVDVPQVGAEPTTIDVSSPSAAVVRLTNSGADEVHWSGDGKTINWSLGASYFQLPLSAVTSSITQTEKPNTAAWAKHLHPTETHVDIEAARHTPQGTIVLRGAQAVTMRGDEVLPTADIVIKDNRIISVGRRGSAKIPANAKIIDVSGNTIVPGFVDTHAHWFQIRRSVLDLGNWDFLASLAYGITTGRDPQTMTNDIFPYQDLVDAGEIIGPRVYTTGPGFLCKRSAIC